MGKPIIKTAAQRGQELVKSILGDGHGKRTQEEAKWNMGAEQLDNKRARVRKETEQWQMLSRPLLDGGQGKRSGDVVEGF